MKSKQSKPSSQTKAEQRENAIRSVHERTTTLEFFHDQGNRAWVSVAVGDHRENLEEKDLTETGNARAAREMKRANYQYLTHWSDKRLVRLFKRYNRTYWRGKLSGYRVVLVGLSEKGAIGCCNRREKRIEIDPHQHTSDRELRVTLLHEMAHAAAREPGHGVRFFAQMERLIRLGAPVTVGSPEAGKASILDDMVPKRFPMLRAKMQRLEKRRASAILKFTREKDSNSTP